MTGFRGNAETLIIMAGMKLFSSTVFSTSSITHSLTQSSQPQEQRIRIVCSASSTLASFDREQLRSARMTEAPPWTMLSKQDSRVKIGAKMDFDTFPSQ